MKVYKFGGASIHNIERIKNVAKILESSKERPLFLVVSAMGKTTNALEKVVESFYSKKGELSRSLFEEIKESHRSLAKSLLNQFLDETESRLLDIFTEIEWIILGNPERPFDYYYDQIVPAGELMSTIILSGYLKESGLENLWLDVRDLIRTDSNFRDANIDWISTKQRVQDIIAPALQSYSILLTQGFIGSTSENESTTLGREGSDYSAAIFANLLEAEDLTIWKDVEGVMNADPKEFASASVIRELNYDEVIEMAYYGAQVIHPKTIKPLQNKSIPLLVKSFIDPSLPGTRIHNQKIDHLPAILVLKKNQALIQLQSKDFSFVGERTMSKIYQWLTASKLSANLIQSGAISVFVCVENEAPRLQTFSAYASPEFDLEIKSGLTLLTVRHYTKDLIKTLVVEENQILKQQSRQIVQVLVE